MLSREQVCVPNLNVELEGSLGWKRNENLWIDKETYL